MNPNQVKVLVEGYAQVNPDGTWDATSTTTLITSGKLKIIMDPGCNRDLLLKALSKENLKVGDIDYVFVSHYHPDHCLLMGIFPQAKVFDSIQWQDGAKGGETGQFLPDTDIEIIKTPGHTADHASLLVKTQQGRVLVGADIFWWPIGEDQNPQINQPDEFASDMETIKLSRTKALEISDFIIPGHGQMFKVLKK